MNKIQFRRPLCVFVLLLICILYLTGFLFDKLAGQKTEAKKEAVPSQKQIECIGTLIGKQVKNGQLIYSLKDIQIVADSANSSKNEQLNIEQTNIIFLTGINAYMGKVEEPISEIYGPTGILSKPPYIGSKVKIQGTFQNYESAVNEGQFDAKAYYSILGYDGMLWKAQLIEQSREFDKLKKFMFQLKCYLADFWYNNMAEEKAGVICAMVLANKAGLDSEIKALYQKNGIAHILAVSGLHISILGMLFYKLLRRIGVWPWLSAIFGMLLIYLYSVMIQASSSAFRASCMFFIMLIGEILGRNYDLLTAMAFSAFLLILSNPDYLYYSGFLMSYGALGGISIVLPVFSDYLKNRKMAGQIDRKKKKSVNRIFCKISSLKFISKLLQSLLAGFSILLITLPIILSNYYSFAPYSILLNIFVVPLMSIVLLSAILGAVCRCKIMLWPAAGILDTYEILCEITQKIKFGNIITGCPKPWQIFLYYVILAFFLCVINKKSKLTLRIWEMGKVDAITKKKMSFYKYSFFIILIAFIILFLPARKIQTVDMLNVGQGDCVVVRDRKVCLMFDGGSSDVKEVGKNRVIPYLKYNGIKEIDMALVSHGHGDHYSAILEILEDGKEEGITIRNLCVSKNEKDETNIKNIVLIAKNSGCKVWYMDAKDRICCGSFSLNCLLPKENESFTDENDTSIVMYVKHQKTNFSMLFTGDLTSDRDTELIHALKEQGYMGEGVDYYKCEHHGAKTSNSEELIEFLEPRGVYISCGKDNSYGHPHKETLERLRKLDIPYYVTKDCGQIRVRMKGRRGKTKEKY